MLCLTEEECVSWIKEHSLTAFPYGDWAGYPKLAAGHYRQLNIKEMRSDWAEHLVEVISPIESILLWIVDGGWTSAPIEALIKAVRGNHGELRPVESAPGHLFGPGEEAELAGLFFLTMIIGSCAYLYATDSETIFYNWEGDLVDTWTKSEKHKKAIEIL